MPNRASSSKSVKTSPALSPGAISEALFCLDPDRDERASQLCSETLLTLARNAYEAPADPANLVSPKQQKFAIRSLALGENFLAGQDAGRAAEDDTTPAQYGDKLAGGIDFRGSANLNRAQLALQGLIDPETQRGQQPGAWLLRPFHESLLWYDARRESTRSTKYSVRKVYMRGAGITLARLLADPADPNSVADGRRAVKAIQEALTSPTPLAAISDTVEKALPIGEEFAFTKPPKIEEDEQQAWRRGGDRRLLELTGNLCRHAANVMEQGSASAPAKLWQLRTVLALDLAVHLIRTAWSAINTVADDQYILLSFGGLPRALDPVRQRSEGSYRRTKIQLNRAILQTLADRMFQLHEENSNTNWGAYFQKGSALGDVDDAGSVINLLGGLPVRPTRADFERIARVAVEAANYSRGAEDGFRVLMESVGAIGGTGAYRYFTAGPELLGALVGALSDQMPMSSREFFAAVRRQWGLVVNQEGAASTALAAHLDGAGLERNARRAEILMSDAGLAIGLSDRTMMVGERAAKRGHE